MNGQQLVQAEEDVLLFNADVKAFAEAVIVALEERFPEDQLMYSASVIDPSLIPSADDDMELLTLLIFFLRLSIRKNWKKSGCVLNLLNSEPQVYKLLNVLSGIFIFSIGKHFLTYGNWCRFFSYFLSTQQHVNEAFRL